MGLIDNIMRPILVGKQTRLHTIVIFYAVLGGLKVFGPLGLVFGPVIVVCFSTLLKFIAPHHEETEETEEDEPEAPNCEPPVKLQETRPA